MDLLWAFLTALALLGLVVTAASLLQGLRLRGHVRRAMRAAFGAYLPRVAIVLPIRGLDPGLQENLEAILSQTYPGYRVLVVVDDPGDPGADLARKAGASRPGVPLTIVVSEAASLPGKVNAVRSALAHLVPDDEVIAFADSDIRPPTDWLRQLVQPLADTSVGVATGFRWYVPPRPQFWSLVRAEWNSVSANVLFDPRRSFAWGGSCAARRETLSEIRISERWRETLSDDLVLTQAIREAHLKIAYCPACLVPTFEGATRAACLEWCLRQMTMATLYLPIVRRYAAAAFAVFNGSTVLGIVSALLSIGLGPAYLIPSALFLAPLPATVAKSFLRRRALFSAGPAVAAAWNVPGWRTALAALAVPWVMAFGLLRTRDPRVVRWRGRDYDVTDPKHVRLVDQT
ncbi:MAG TPA: glycosyltransferase family 2 protein [Thermoplasmata archaeon]|nr:glycosyltransferase family 2 protein [Thermoplasmata archaeon]